MKLGTIKSCDYCGSDFPYEGRGQRFCKSCKENVPENRRFVSTIDGRIKKLRHMARNRANNKRLPFDLTVDYLLDLWESQEGKCAVSGRELELEYSDKFRQVNPNAPSIDRIVPEKGYTIGNVRFLTYHANICVNEFGDDELYSLIEDINARRGRVR